MDKDKISSTFSEQPIDSLKCRREDDEIRYEKIDKYPVYVEPFHVDFTGRIFLGILGNHLLNAAGNHSQKRGWGMGALNETHHTWVLSRLSIEMTEMPRQYEHVEIRTWVESVSLYDGDILNYVVTPEENMCPIEGHGRFRFRNPELVRIVETYYSDVDINGHINSIKYIEHILDLFPKQRFEQQDIRRFEIAYKSEAYMGDRLYFYIQATEPDSQDSVDIEVRKDGVDVVCQARVTFWSESCAFGLAADSV